MRGVRRHDEHVAHDDGLRATARDQVTAEVIRVVALLVEKLATRHDVAGALEHNNQLGILFMQGRGRRAGTVFELGAIGRHRQDRLGDEGTASNIYNFVSIDGGNIANYPNTPLSFRKSQFEAAGDYRLAKNQHVRVAYTHEDISRWCNQYAANAGYPPDTNCVVAKGSIEDKLNATYRYSETGSLSSYVTQQHRDRAMTDQQRTSTSGAAATATVIAVPAGATWSDKLTDDDVTVGLGVKHTGLLNGKLDLSGDASYSLVKSGYTTPFNYATTTLTGLTCADPTFFSRGSTPDVKTTISQLQFTGTYQIDKKAKVALRYIYQRMSGADYYYNGYQLGFTPTQVMPTNQQLGNYSVNVISLSYIYSF